MAVALNPAKKLTSGSVSKMPDASSAAPGSRMDALKALKPSRSKKNGSSTRPAKTSPPVAIGEFVPVTPAA